VPRHRVKHQTKAVQTRRKRAARSQTVSPPFRANLAPFQAIIAVGHRPLVPVSNARDRYLWLAGLAFAVLAIAGLSLQVLSVRYFRPELG
jgi:hypothetical protein